MTTRALRGAWAEPVARAIIDVTPAGMWTPPEAKEKLVKALADMIEAIEEHHLETYHGDP